MTEDQDSIIQDIYTLSPMQEGMLFHSLLDKNSEAYFQQIVLSINGCFIADIFKKSMGALIKRHEALRTVILHEEMERPLQVVLKECECEVVYEDISRYGEEDRELYVEEYKRKDRQRGFDLSKDVLIRTAVLKIEEQQYLVILSFHHIIMDGWCLGILMKDLFGSYRALLDGKPGNPGAVYPYSSYIEWLEQQDKNAGREYWKEYLKEYAQRTGLPDLRRGEDSGVYRRQEAVFTLDEAITKGLEDLAKKESVTLNTILQSVWGVLLQRYNNTQDAVFGAVVSGRPYEVRGIETMVGLFINTIPVRVMNGENTSFRQLVRQVQDAALKSDIYHYMQLADIESESELKQELIDNIVVFENYPIQKEGLNLVNKDELGFEICGVEVFDQTSYDFNVVVVPGSNLEIKFIYNANVYGRDIVDRIPGHLIRVAEEVVENPDILVGKINILPEEEKKEILEKFNNTEAAYPKDSTIYALFEEQVEKAPDNIALVFEDKQLTYRQLNDKANRLARVLREKGVKADSIVGIMIERSIEMIIGILAIIKAGGGYLPIDPDYPRERILSMLDDSNAGVLLTNSNAVVEMPFCLLEGIHASKTDHIYTKARDQILELDTLPIPDRTLVDYERYHKHIGLGAARNSITIQATRGCPYNCAFCHKIWPKKHVVRSAENIFKEIEIYYNVGTRRFVFIDDIFNLDMKNSSRLLNMIVESNMKVMLYFPNGLRGDILTKEYIDLMVKAGMVNLSLALETASPRLQKLVGKNMNLDKLRDNIRYILEKHPHVIVELESIHGFPTESEEEAIMTLSFIKELKWLHFPYVHLLKIYPNTDMARLAEENGISRELIEKCVNLAYHEFSDTLPFSKSFTSEYKADFYNNYFMNKERLLYVLPLQMKVMTEKELVAKYDSYLPVKIDSFDALLKLMNITAGELGDAAFADEGYGAVPHFNEAIREYFPRKEHDEDALRILFLDLSQYFTADRGEVYDVVEAPLGQIYLLSYLNEVFGSKISGKIAKARIDFDRYDELKKLIDEFKPDVIGIRTLSIYKDFFHKTVSVIRHWGVSVPIIAGGPYATSESSYILNDKNVDLAILGEGEATLRHLVEKMLENNGNLPSKEVLRTIPGICFSENMEALTADREIILLDEIEPQLAEKAGENLSGISKAQNLLYVLYTSGTTGKPKGVKLEQRNLINLIFFEYDKTSIDFSTNVMQFASMSFDVCYQEIFSTLLAGGKLYIIGEEDKKVLSILTGFTQANNINVMFLPTAFLKFVITQGDYEKLIPGSVKHLIVAGEQLVITDKFRMFLSERGICLHNHYGPSETHVVTALTMTQPDMPLIPPIGTPVSNTRMYILGREKTLQPVGASGELYICGDNVGRGYLNRPELTAERFVDNPFEPGKKMYRTGDLARWLPDGNIEFLGRTDHQVKIRGFRIELGEVEAKLLKHEDIEEALVVVKEGENGDKYLCAYTVQQKDITVPDIREYLSRELPGYMIPSYFIKLERMPLTPNGKVDRKALPGPDGSIKTATEYEAPAGITEETLAEIWQDILGVNKVGVKDSFFELGGHSLKVTMLVSRIHREFGVEMPLKEVFSRQSIRNLAEYIRGAGTSMYASIAKAEEKEYYPASASQKRLYLLGQIEGPSTVYNMPGIMTAEGRLDRDRLEHTFTQLAARHEALRTSFGAVEGEPVQRVHKEAGFDIEYTECSEEEAGEAVKRFIRPFELDKAPLMRAGLIKIEEDRHILMVDMHHIISDGISLGIFIREFTSLYNGQTLPELRIQYKDFSEWQNSLFNSGELKKQEEYWLDVFSGEIPALDMPADYPRPGMQSFEGGSIAFGIDRELTGRIRELSLRTGTTLYMTLLGAYSIMLAKYSGQEDIVVGSPIAGRPHADLENIMGMFVNTLAMRNYPQGNKTVEEFLKEVKENSLMAYENQDYQFEELVERLEIKRDLSRNPLFDTMFALQNADMGELELPGLKLKPYAAENRVSRFDITLNASEQGEGIAFVLEYCTKLFKKETMERLSGHYANILREMAANPGMKISEIDMMSEEERRRILYDFNDTAAEYPKGSTIHELFEEQAEKAPGNTALVFEDKRLTYRQLNEKSNQLARTLREKGIKPNSIVGIMTERSPETVIGILGILKAGGAYLPIDPGYPKDRIRYMLEDSRAEIVLTQGFLKEKVSFNGEVADLEDEELYVGESSELMAVNTPDDLAYVIYTSGSTGKPKGVLVRHSSVVNILYTLQQKYPLTESGTYLLKTAYTFDVSAAEIFGWFFDGGRLAILAPGDEKIPGKIVEAIGKYNVTHINFVPSMFNVFVKVLDKAEAEIVSKLKYMFLAGEAVAPNAVERFRGMNIKVSLNNIYGPTECTIYATAYSLEEYRCGASIPIGRPLSNLQSYILNINNKIQPVGIAGELCIGGEGLARGYLNRPELTAERFVDNPFKPGKKMYRTGDLARWLPDGNIEFLGRIDHQVKIRGFRIELGEVEARLLKHKDIKEALVIAKEGENGDKYLCAYTVQQKDITVPDIREYLSRELPDYMIPSYFIKLERMPLNPNGKLDRKALPEPDGSVKAATEYGAPANITEEKLAEIWKGILGVNKIGVNDNFFELGGHSLKAAMLASRIHREFDVEVPLKEIFSRQSIRNLAGYIRETGTSIYASIEKAEEKEYYPASSAQKRLYVLGKMEGPSTVYNMPGIMTAEGRLDRNRLEHTFTQLLARHEALRTSFEAIEGEPVQRVHKEAGLDIEYTECSGEEAGEAVKRFIRPFELDKAPLIRVGLLKIEEDRHMLMVDMHHIISDGASLGIIIKEFTSLYNGQALPEPKLRYKDFSEWQNSLFNSGELKKQEEYWLDVFSGEIPALDMPADYPRPGMQSFEGGSIAFGIDRELTGRIRELSLRTGTTLYMTLLGAYSIMLAKYSGQEDIVVGSPIAGRPHADLENIMGMFVNTLAMRNYPQGNKTVEEFLKEVKENSLMAYENQDYQFEELVERLEIKRDLSRNPLFDTMFALQNADMGELELPGLKLKPYAAENRVSRFDITLNASEQGEGIAFVLEYCTKLFKKETMERLSGHYANILREMAANPGMKISEIDMMSEEERRRILYGFNGTAAEYPKGGTIHELFEEQAGKAPGNTALVFGDKQLTYRQLNGRANQLARVLREKRVAPNSIVGIMTERSPEMVIGILGILKAGGAYLPIDPGYPQDRIRYMLEDSRAEIVLAHAHIADKVSFKGEVIELSDEEIYKRDAANVDNINSMNDLAYVIYTSGSTGKPKANLTTHSNTMGIVKSTDYIDVADTDVFLQLSNYAFDGSIFDIFGALLNGAKLVLAGKDAVLDMRLLSQVIEESGITVSFMTTALFNTLADVRIDCFKNIRKVLFGGERVSVPHARKVLEYLGRGRIIHVYGPTEATVFASYYLIDDIENNASNIPIGKPLSNSKLYVLDKYGRLQPVNIPGELCIGGEGVARGYLNRPELTAERFVDNPFDPGNKMYRTGDLARWLPDGNIEFLGRMDHQVKIRGFRIELGEVEAQLLKHKDIKEALVIAKEAENGDRYLCAYMVTEKDIAVSEMREYLSRELPGYMIPAYFIKLERMPLTPNGKVDRKALPELDGSIKTGAEYEAPADITEEKLVEIWQDMLGVNKIGVKDSFFDVGGHSLKAAMLVSRMHREFNVEIPLREIFSRQSIKNLAKYIRETESSIYSSIIKAQEKEYYPASSAQKRLYVLSRMEGPSTVYNMPGIMMAEGRLDRERLENAFRQLLVRHEALRTSFEAVEGEPVQRVHKKPGFEMEYTECSGEEAGEAVKRFIRPFDLGKAPLMRAGLLKIREDRHILMMDMHHIISDGTSLGIIIREFASLYNGQALPELKIQYKDFSEWQNSLFNSGEIKKQEKYWLDTFSGEIPVLSMPTDYPRPGVQSFEGDSIAFEIDRELTDKIRALSSSMGITLYMTLLGVYNIMLAKYSGQEDIVVGSPIAGRPHADLENVMGMFVNTLAMRNHPKDGKTVEEFLKEVKENSLMAYENQGYQFEELVEKLEIKRDLSRNPLFDAMFALQNEEIGQLEIPGLRLSSFRSENRISKFDISLHASEEGEGIVFALEYCAKLFKKETMERLSGHYVNILREITGKPWANIYEIDMMSEGERRRILCDFNDTEAEYPRNRTIHELFEEQAEKTPESIALVFEDKQLTYRQLNERSNQLARVLRNNGVIPDTIVGIMAERSLDMIVGILGVLKAGGAYLPIDPAYPQDRIRYMLEDSGINILITQQIFSYKAGNVAKVYYLEDEQIYSTDGSSLEHVSAPGSLLYTIYTSGSTGNPKGVMLEHGNMVNLINYEYKGTNINFADRVLQFTTISFDVCYQEIFSVLLAGGKLFIVNSELKNDIIRLLRYIEAEDIHVVFFPTSLLKFITGHDEYLGIFPACVKHIITAGEQLVIKYEFKEWLKTNKVCLHNHYGPSETHVVTALTLEPERNVPEVIPIGKPIYNTKIYIMDGRCRLQPMNITGEIYIAGDSVGRGYLNRPELTEEKFMDNPFIPGERMYRTGDLARWLPDGNIEFLGRTDHQVKIRGFRIELGEIEAKLLKHKDIKEALVVAKEGANGDKYLCAYIVQEKDVAVPGIREHLSGELPDYMIPSYFIELERMPLTPNGKVDRKALPLPGGSIKTGAEYEAPGNAIEEKLAEIWREILGVDRIGVKDSFFQLGGHSLKAIMLVSRIHREFNVEIPLREIFSRQSIKNLAEYIRETESSIYSSIGKAEEKEYYPASSAQKRLYVLEQMEGPSTVYNIPGIMTAEGRLDREKLEHAFGQLAARHEILRTSFEVIEGEPVQRVHKETGFDIEYMECSEGDADGIVKGFIRPFDLGKAPLMRVGLLKIREDRHILMMDMHHIISDGTSLGIIIREFASLYDGRGLPELRIQYKDFSEWQNNLLNSGEIKKQGEYWFDVFSKEIPVLDMPADYPRPGMQSFEGDSITFGADRELTDKIRELSSNMGVTLYMTLLGAYNIMLAKYSGQEDIVVGSPIAGRPHADLENIMGMFVNTLAMRNFPQGSKTVEEFLKEVKETSLRAYENQDYQFEELVERLEIKRDLSRNPLFDVMFALQNEEMGQLEIPGLRLSPFRAENRISRLDMTMNASEEGEGIAFVLEYCSKLFKKETMERLSGHYINILREMAGKPGMKISEINMMSEEERRRILYDFNDTAAEYPKGSTIHELLEEQAEKAPESIALVFEDKQLTYRQLNERSNQLARVLRNKGVVPGAIVGIMAERSLEMIAGIFGILKAGGAYLPIDPEYPQDRIIYMLEDSGTKILLIKGKRQQKLAFDGETVDLGDDELYRCGSFELNVINTPDDLAYVIYTSGSTGKPKGVMIRHISVNNLIKGIADKIEFLPGKTILCITTISFDIFVLETLMPLAIGMKVIIAGDNCRNDPKLVLDLIKENNIDMLQMTPLRMSMLIKGKDSGDLPFDNLKEIMIGGEAFSESLLNQVRKVTNARIYNMYGPTETTVWSAVNELTRACKVTIGKPIANTHMYILDENKQPVPIGAAGEIYISGAGLARGYLNRPELNSERFVDNIFEPGERMYRTGDIARWQPDGNIEFLGRVDHQVKIRGFRIELGEIEAQLLSHEDIKEAIVTAKEGGNEDKYLCAYITAEKDITISGIREYLLKELPDYMIPSYFIRLEHIPLTPNGKIDRKALPEPDGSIKTGIKYEAPANATEEKLVEIWQEILGIDGIGINDNFFELGGHSLKALSLLSKISETFNTKLFIAEILNNSTVKMIAKRLESSAQRLSENVLGSSEAILLNNKAPKNIFAYPPLGGYALAFKNMAGHIDSHSLYGLNFIEEEDRIEKYVELITGIQKEGPYILLGYSAGGNLAFEVARGLISRGGIVSDLIIIDSYRKTKISMRTDEEIRLDVNEMLAHIQRNREYSELLKDEFLKESLARKIKVYMGYMNRLVNEATINANIHFIRSSSNVKETWKEEADKYGEWSNSTSMLFKEYQGFGSHDQMLDPRYLNDNVKIIKNIFEKT